MPRRKAGLIKDNKDRGMKEIEDLYNNMFADDPGPDSKACNIRQQIKSRLHKRILKEIEELRGVQKLTEEGSMEYGEIDQRIRRRILKEIQIIIDAYIIASQERRLKEWETMYGDIEHYKREFFYFRMDPDYDSLRKALHDYKFIED